MIVFFKHQNNTHSNQHNMDYNNDNINKRLFCCYLQMIVFTMFYYSEKEEFENEQINKEDEQQPPLKKRKLNNNNILNQNEYDIQLSHNDHIFQSCYKKKKTERMLI